MALSPKTAEASKHSDSRMSLLHSEAKNPFGVPGVTDRVKKELNWLTIERENGVGGAGVYSVEGQVYVHDDNVEEVDSAEQDPYYNQLGHMVAPILATFSRLSENEAFRNVIGTVFGSPTAMRVTLDDKRYVGIVPLDPRYSFFLVAVVWNRYGSEKRRPYNDELFREDIRVVRDNISEVLQAASR